jgi:hypothetical protein
VIPARVDLTLDRRSRAGDRQALVAREDLDQLELAGRHGGE